MASPFSVFRKNQKVLLATVGLAAIIAFVFLTPLMSYMGSGTKQENPVVVETNYGDLTRNELDNLKYSRNVVDRLLLSLATEVISKEIAQGRLDPRRAQAIVQQYYRSLQAQLMFRSHQEPEQAALETMILAKRAEELGVVVSDQAINDLLKQITADSISPAELQDVIRRLQPTRPISVKRLFAAIRTEMMASEYSRLFQQSMRDIPPALRFEYYSRLNRRASAEVMPLAVGEFVDQVADPSPAELKKFYDQYKNDLPNPNTPEPGFKEAERATFQYFKADIDQLTEQIKPEITEEEIKKYYDDNKEQFRAFDFDTEPDATDEPAAEDEGEGEGKSDDTPPADEPKSDAEGDKTEPSPEEKPAESDKPAESEAADEAPSDEKPAEEKPAEEKPAKPEADEAAEDETAPESARSSVRSAIRLVSTQQSDDEGATEAEPAEESPKEDNAPAEPKEEPAEKPEASPSEEIPADEKPEEKPAEPTEEKPANEPTEQPAETAAEGDMPAEEPAEPRFEPLEKVADTIRTSLARSQVEVRVTEQFEKLSGELRRHTDELDIYAAEKGIDPKAKPPAPLDFEKLAEGTDLQALELKSVTAAEAAQSDLGKAFRVIQNPNTQFPFTVPFVDFAFAETLPTHKAEVIQDNENHVYLFWKTSEEPAFVPPLDQVRGKVVLAWKMIKARELARKRGEEYAAQARSLKKPLSELFGSQSKLAIAETGPFTWLTLGNVPAQPNAPPRLSDVEGVDRPGKDFMKVVFGLKSGGVDVAANEPQTTVYVVRLMEFAPPTDELRDDFARTNPNRYMAAGLDDQRAIYQAWLSELDKEAGVNWLRQADARAESAESGF